MSDDELQVLLRVAETGRVHPDTFKGQGMLVSFLIRRGYLEWERGRAPHSLRATALLITDFGRQTVSLKSSPEETT